VAKNITFLDKAFWLTETVHSPKHVAGLQLFELPESADENYISHFVEELKSFSRGVEPFNCKVKQFLGYPLSLVPLEELDMEYHIKSHKVDDISDRQSLHELAANIHEQRLDVDKPLWQYHVIESPNAKEFAVYIKIHHMYGDGITIVRWFQSAYKEQIDTENYAPFWAVNQPKRKPKTQSKQTKILSSIVGFFHATKDFLMIWFRLLLKVLHISKNYMPVPFTGTKTMLTGQVKSGRVVTTVDLPFSTIKSISKKLNVTVNEVLLCCFDMGVNLFLEQHKHTTNKALYSNMPINLRKPDDHSSGNKIAIVPVQLAYGETDPAKRLAQIVENHRVVIQAAKKAHPASFSYYTVAIQSFALIYELLRISSWFKPIANILVSNIPGPKETRYLKDCKVKSIYPISAITPGGGINITLLTYNDTANIGMVCCDLEIKSIEPLADYFTQALSDLEKAAEQQS